MTEHRERLFVDAELHRFDQLLLEEYLKIGIPVDQLAYTDQFEVIYKALLAAGDTRTKAEVFRRLLGLRKAGRLPRVA